MADLKSDPKSIPEQFIGEAEKRGIANIQHETEQALAALKDYAEAVAALPKASTDLLASSVIAEAQSFVVLKSSYAPPAKVDFVRIQTQGLNDREIQIPLGMQHGVCHGVPLEPGKYRALFFVVKTE